MTGDIVEPSTLARSRTRGSVLTPSLAEDGAQVGDQGVDRGGGLHGGAFQRAKNETRRRAPADREPAAASGRSGQKPIDWSRNLLVYRSAATSPDFGGAPASV